MQHVTHASSVPQISIATTRTTPNKTNKINGPDRSNTSLVTSRNASIALQRRMYITGIMKDVTTPKKTAKADPKQTDQNHRNHKDHSNSIRVSIPGEKSERHQDRQRQRRDDENGYEHHRQRKQEIAVAFAAIFPPGHHDRTAVFHHAVQKNEAAP